MKNLYVIDASGYLYRAYFAIRNMTNPKGESTNALFGFIRSVLKLIKDFDPTHVVAVFDGPQGKELRTQMYKEYKAHRSATPDDLRYQIVWAQEFCDLIGIPKFVIPGYEADDVMGAVAAWGKKEGAHVYLCTSDKDMAQCVDENISLLNTHKENLILDAQKVEEVYGVPPKKIIDYLAIIGDSSDNVPGLPGFGPKTAIELLKEFGTLEAILALPEKIQGKRRQTIEQESEKARISKKLVTLITDINLPKEQEYYKLKSAPAEPLRIFYTTHNFNTLLKEMGSEVQEEEIPTTYTVVDEESSLDKLLEMLKKEKEICFDIETTDEKELVGIGFSVQIGVAFYVPCNGKLGLQRVVESVKPLFENPKIQFFGQNVKYPIHILSDYGIKLKNISFDTILATYILNSAIRQQNFDQLALNYFGKVKTPLASLLGTGRNQIKIKDVPIEKVAEYCCEDADYTFRLREVLGKELKERKLEHILFDIELPLLHVLVKMEREGIYVNVPFLEKMGLGVSEEIKRLEHEIYEIAGEVFNINSPKQLSIILFTKMGIKAPKKTATGLSTNAEVLEMLQEEHPIAGKMIEYRTVEKLRSTYIETLPLEVNPKTHRIHPTFNQWVAATGRLSCQDPNLQNIPIRSEIGRQIREAFTPQKKDWSFLAADYSQIELRLLAHMSEDPILLEAFRNNQDIHTHTAATVFGIPINEVTKEQRFQAKAVNFGIIYGQQAFGLAKELGISVENASNFIRKYFERYSRVRDFVESCKEKTRKTGKAVTITGRERPIPEINSKNGLIRAAAERLAVNTPLQGTAADLIKLAMIEIDEVLAKEQKLGYMILQIHDELIFEIPDFEILAFEILVKKYMEGVFKLKVPLVVDISIGKNWKEC